MYRLSSDQSILKKGNQFNTLDFEAERNRLYEYFKNKGVYNFQLNAIDFEIGWDTLGTDFQLPVKLFIQDFRRNSENGILLEPYTQKKISSVSVYTAPKSEVTRQKNMMTYNF